MADRVDRRTLLAMGGALAGSLAVPSCRTPTDREATESGPAAARRSKGARPAPSRTRTHEKRRPSLLGPAIHVDPHFAYYGGRSAESIAEEIELAGYRVVHLLVVNELRVDGELIRALKRRDISVWAVVFGNGTYSTHDLPPDWPEWRMKLLSDGPELGYTFLSHFSAEYRAWKKAVAASLVADHPVDGFAIMEAFFPEWAGLESGVYGDVGTLARAAFERTHDMEAPRFGDPRSPLHFAAPANRARYRTWVEFRVNAVNSLVDEIVNGPGGVRATRDDVAVATWSVAVDAGPRARQRLREYQGLDAAAMVTAVRPDLHMFQTHWPDWTRIDLPPDYARAYAPFIDEVRRVAPNLPVGIQADIGSKRPVIRTRSWLTGFADTVQNMGCETWVAYEYHIGGYMYSEPPRPVVARRLDERRVRISFSKRIDGASTYFPDTFTVVGESVHTLATLVDGNRATVTWDRAIPIDARIAVRNVRDTPHLWFRTAAHQTPNAVPPGTEIRIT